MPVMTSLPRSGARHAALTLTALLATAAAITPLATAAQSAPAAKVTGAYLDIQKMNAVSGGHAKLQPFATLVFKTDRQLPRRFDGLIRAGASVAGQSGSVGSVHGKASRCYTVNARIKPDNTITGTSPGGKRLQTKARAGSRLHVEITTAKGATTVKRTLTLRDAKPGDVTGKPLGC